MRDEEKSYVYCSGPLFSPEEVGGMEVIAKVLERAGFGTFLPHRDGIEAYVMRYVNSPIATDVLGSRSMIDKAIFALDLFQLLERCSYFVMNMNGRVPDEGAVAETALAFSAGKPVVIYKNDHRTAFNGRDNSMLTGLTSLPPVSDVKALPDALARAVAKTGQSTFAADRAPPQVQEALKRGRKIWVMMGALRLHGKKEKVVSELVAEIAKICEEPAGD